jgi:hypothetical protein
VRGTPHSTQDLGKKKEELKVARKEELKVARKEELKDKAILFCVYSIVN